MTLFGGIWIILLMLSMFSKSNKMIFVLTIVSAVLQCDNVLAIKNIGIGPQVITSTVLFIKVFFTREKSFKLKINKKVFPYEISTLLICGIALMSLLVNHKIRESGIRLLQLFTYILCFISMTKLNEEIDEEYIFKTIKYLTIFLICMGYLQLLITTGNFPRLFIIRQLLFNDNISNVIYFTRNNYFRILSTFMEPSYYACYLIGAFYYLLVNGNKLTRYKYILYIFMILQIILTFSTTAYIAFLGVGIIYLMRERNIKIKVIILILGIILIAAMYYGFYNVLDTVFFSKAESGSANARFSWNERALKIFKNNKIIGVGYKTSRASSVVYTILAEMGIIGFISYILLNLRIIAGIFKFNNSKQELSIRYALLGVIIAQIIAVPDIDICAYWMWMDLFGIVMSKNKQGEINEK